MFETLEMAPPDPILGLNALFARDTRPGKINLGVGVFQDEAGKTPTLACVRKAEEALLAAAAPKTYLPIEGTAEYGKHVRGLLFGVGASLVADGRAVTAQALGGTGALRVAGDLAKAKLGIRTVWMSDPTWANHPAIFQAAGLATESYAYYDSATQGLSFEKLIASLEKAGPTDAVLLHACCHNPSGVDPSPAEWDRIAEVAERRGFLPILDFAYQGFGDGVEADALSVRKLAERGLELLVCSSFSKNFGLYNERVGAITLVAREAAAAEKALSHLKVTIRSNYSNPSLHGGAIVSRILSDADLTALWHREVDAMRARIAGMRTRFVETLEAKGVTRDFRFIARQKGMFSFAGLSPEQVDRLRDEFGIYAVRSGRINVAGIREADLDRLCSAIQSVL